MEDNTNYGLLAYDKAELLEKELDSLRKNSAGGLSGRVDKLEEDQNTIKTNLQTINDTIDAHGENIDTLNASAVTNSSAISELQTTQNEQDVVLTSLEGSVNTHTEQITTLETNVANNSERISEHYMSFTNAFNAAMNGVRDVEAVNESQDAKINTLISNVNGLELSCTNSYEMANTAKTDVANMQSTMDNLQSAVNTNTANIAILQSSQGGSSGATTTSEQFDTYYQNTDGCTLLQEYSAVSKDYPHLDFYARYFGYLTGTLSIEFKGVTTSASVTADISLYCDDVVREVKSLTLANGATSIVTFNVNIPFKRGLHKMYVHTETTTQNGDDNLAIVSYNYALPHAHIECLTTPMKYFAGLGTTTELLGVSDGHSGRYAWRNTRTNPAFGDDFGSIVHAGTFDVVGEVVTIGVYVHPVNSAYVNPNIIARTHGTNTYMAYSDFSNGSQYTYSITLDKRPKAIDCVSAKYKPGDYVEGRLNLVYMDDDGYLKVEGFMHDGSLFKMEYPDITDKAYRIVHSRTYAGKVINLMDFMIETEDGQLVHYNFQGTASYLEPTAIYRHELGYGRDPVLTWDHTLGCYVLLYKKRGGIYRKEFTLDTTTGTYNILSDTYLCDGDYAYFFDKNTSYAFAFDDKFMRVAQDNPVTY